MHEIKDTSQDSFQIMKELLLLLKWKMENKYKNISKIANASGLEGRCPEIPGSGSRSIDASGNFFAEFWTRTQEDCRGRTACAL